MDLLRGEAVLLQHLEAVISLRAARLSASPPGRHAHMNLMMLTIREMQDSDLTTLIHAPAAVPVMPAHPTTASAHSVSLITPIESAPLCNVDL